MRGFIGFFLIWLAIFSADSAAADKILDPAEVAGEKVKITQTGDKFQGTEYWAGRPKSLPGVGLFTTLYINPVFMRKTDGPAGYYLWVNYSGFGWLYPSGKVIFLLDDGSKVELLNESVKVESKVDSCTSGSCLVTEVFRIAIDEKDMQRLAAAKSVEVAVYGRSLYVAAYFKPYHQATVQAVLKIGGSMGGQKLAAQP